MPTIAESGLVPSFFVAYCQRHEEYAQRVYNVLRELDFDVYCMTDNPYGIPDFVRAGKEELERRRCMVVIVGSHQSDWVDLEVQHALEIKKPVFPVLCVEDVHAVNWPYGVNRKGVYVHIAKSDQANVAELLLRGLVDFGLLDHGIVPRAALMRSRSFTVNPFRGCEQFASELIEQPVQINRGADGLHVQLNRDSCKYVVISNAGKKAMQKAFVYPRRAEIADAEHRLSLLTDATRPGVGDTRPIVMPDGIPMRWASGGVLPIVEFRGRQWVAMLFRDVAPYGWNLPLGASERHSGVTASHEEATQLWEDELRQPARLATREFLEELLVVDGAPGKGAPLRVRPFRFVDDLKPYLHKRYTEFSSAHIQMRNRQDGLFVQMKGGQDIFVGVQQGTRWFVDVLSRDNSDLCLFGLLVCVNPSEMGIEMVLPLRFRLNDDDCILDGEIISWKGESELVRMPVALFSVEYLRRALSGPGALTFVDVPLNDPLSPPESRPPGVKVEIPLTADDVHVFTWDIDKRRAIAQQTGGVAPNELRRHQRWVELFGGMFTGNAGDLPTWFTPTTAKTIRMAIAAGLL